MELSPEPLICQSVDGDPVRRFSHFTGLVASAAHPVLA
jgi:hypothetical protein